MRIRQLAALTTLLLATGSVTASDVVDDLPPGQGVLCFGTIVYVVEDYGQRCLRGQDAAFQTRLASLVQRFDAYILRNSGGDALQLQQFKEGQGVGVGQNAEICGNHDISGFYEAIRDTDPAKVEDDVEKLLARDGPPSFGDCL